MGLPPNRASSKDRKIAWAIYVLLVCGWLAYTIYFILNQTKERENPPIQQAVTRIKYLQPKFSLCSFNPTIEFLSPECKVVYGKSTRNCSFVVESLAYSAADPSNLDSSIVDGADPEAGAFDVPPEGEGDYFSNSSDLSSSSNFVGQSLVGHPGPSFELQVAGNNASKSQLYCVTFNRERKVTLRPRTDYLKFTTEFEFGFDAGDVRVLSLFAYDGSIDVSNDFIVPYPKQVVLSLEKTVHKSFRKNTLATYDANVASLDYDPNAIPSPPQFIVEIQIKIANYEVAVTTEVDPLNPTLIMGTITGFWNLVGIAFAFFFIPNPKNKDELVFRRINKVGVQTAINEKAKEMITDG